MCQAVVSASHDQLQDIVESAWMSQVCPCMLEQLGLLRLLPGLPKFDFDFTSIVWLIKFKGRN